MYLVVYTCSSVILICTRVSVESVQHVEQLIGSSKREEEMRLLGLSKMNSEEMLAYVSRQVGQKWSMLARYAGLEEDEIQEIKRSAQDRPCTTMKKIQERLTWNELLVIVQKHVSSCSNRYVHAMELNVI